MAIGDAPNPLEKQLLGMNIIRLSSFHKRPLCMHAALLPRKHQLIGESERGKK
jgi:hypothetical protein